MSQTSVLPATHPDDDRAPRVGMTWLLVAVAAHVPLAYAMHLSATLATAQAGLTVLLVLVLLTSARSPARSSTP